MKKNIVLFVLSFLYLSSLLFTHGMDLRAQKHSPLVLVSSRYINGSVISYAAVSVFYEEQTVEYQNGRSDKKGNFSFMPDKPGKWSFHIDDEMGHAEKIEIIISDSFFSKTGPAKNEDKKQDFYYCKILVGLFLILILTYLVYLWIKKREKAA